MPKVSVIIPVYNVENYLRECLDSIVNQTLKDIEIILVDDGSTDSSLSICNEYAQKDNRITVLTQQNKGVGAARNKGLERATGDYLYFLDSDDFIKLETLEKLYSKITETNSAICFCKNNIYNENTKSVENIDWSTNEKIIPQTETFSSDDIPSTILQICVPNLFLKLYKKEFININDIKFQEIKTCNDVFFNYSSLIMAKRICYVNEVLVTYRKNQADCLSANRGRSAVCIIYAYKKLKEYLENKGIFEKVQDSIYTKALNNFEYEISCCTTKEQKLLKKEIKKFLPYEYFSLFKHGVRYKTPIEKLFSLKNSTDNKHKIITVAGFRISINKEKINA